ncbi:hypothetical protein ACFL0G_04775, partial [Candidatus Zixiibacteriota bacterium]
MRKTADAAKTSVNQRYFKYNIVSLKLSRPNLRHLSRNPIPSTSRKSGDSWVSRIANPMPIEVHRHPGYRFCRIMRD